MNNKLLLIGVFILLLGIVFVGCQSDASRIRATNVAIDRPNPTATTSPLSAEIPSVDIEEGDCINSTLPTGVTFESVEIVPCTQEYQYRTLNLFSLSDSASLPSQDSMRQQAYENCDARFSVYIYPSRESWMRGDKRIACLQESFGLSVSDPAKLDRLVNPFSLGTGACFNLLAEMDSPLVERVNCSGEWGFRIVGTFEADGTDAFPGDDNLSQQAFEECDRRVSFPYAPTPEGWSVGERSVLCTQESYGLSGNDPGKLDRLVTYVSLRFGECFNDAPETRNEQVELVSCSSEWTYKVTSRIDIPVVGPYPGAMFFEEQANEECPEPFAFYYYPSSETWALGDGALLCIEEGF